MKLLKGIASFLWKIYVGAIFVIFALSLYPFFLIVLYHPKWKKISFRLFLFWSWCMRIFCGYFVRKMKQAPLPDGPYIIVSNHSSYLDIFLMYSIFPKHPFLFLGKDEILSYPIIKTYFKGLNIPVYRKDKRKAAISFILAKKAVRDGWSIVIFPEGGIPDENKPALIPFKKGAFKLAKQLNIPIVPVTFTNNYKLFSDPLDFFGTARPGISNVFIHEALSKDKIHEMSENEILEYCFKTINEPILLLQSIKNTNQS
jgi:1-acyl-sn-glycerol-3-phosphate acyltransferase